MAEVKGFEGFAILELMGHRRLGGLVSEATVAGCAMLRIDIPCEPPVTQFYSGQAVYAITPCGEAEARAVAAHNTPQPVSRWEFPRKLLASRVSSGEVPWREEPARHRDDDDDDEYGDRGGDPAFHDDDGEG